jgi:hypothetical protein
MDLFWHTMLVFSGIVSFGCILARFVLNIYDKRREREDGRICA